MKRIGMYVCMYVCMYVRVWNTDGILRGDNMLLIIGMVYPLKVNKVHEHVSPYLQDSCNEKHSNI
jgi:hypothetical protein